MLFNEAFDNNWRNWPIVEFVLLELYIIIIYNDNYYYYNATFDPIQTPLTLFNFDEVQQAGKDRRKKNKFLCKNKALGAP